MIVNSTVSNFTASNPKLCLAEAYTGYANAIDETLSTNYPIWYRAKRVFKRNTAPINNVHVGTNEGFLCWFHRMEITSANLSIGNNSNGAKNYVQYLSYRGNDDVVDSFTTTFTFSYPVGTITWSISRPDLVEIIPTTQIDSTVTDPNHKSVVIKESVGNIVSGTSLGTITGTVIVNGVSCSETIPLIAGCTYPIVLTGPQPVKFLKDDPDLAVSQIYYSVNNSPMWTAFSGFNNLTVNAGNQIKFKGVFSNQGGGNWNYSITSVDHPQINTVKNNDMFGETIITPNTIITGPLNVVFKAVQL